MLEFNYMRDYIRTAVIVLGSLGVTALALAFTLAVYCLHKNRARIVKTALIFCALCQTFVCCAMIAQVQYNATSGFIVPSDYVIMRCVLFGIIMLLSVGLTVSDIRAAEKSFVPPIAAALATALTLPAAERLSGAAFPYLFVSALAIWLVTGCILSYMYAKELRTTISNLSIKQAMDSLDTAVLFYKKNGHILMLNSAMLALMVKTSGKVFRSGTKYMESVAAGAETHETRSTENEASGRSHLYRLLDGSAWLFAETEIGSGTVQVTAADVTDQERATSLLRQTRERLEEQHRHLSGVIDNIEEIYRAEELIRMKSHVHDLMGQKLAVLMRSLRYGNKPDDETLASISADLMQEIQTDETADDPVVMLESIITSFERANGKIMVTGELPGDRNAALVMVQIIREAAVNAFKHAYANEIYAAITRVGGNIVMNITDNSATPPQRVDERGGMSDMRRRLRRIGGDMEVRLEPGFTLVVTIPEVASSRN